MFKLFSCLLLSSSLFLFACNNSTEVQSTSSNDSAIIDGHPAWIEQGNIYEVNIRQYTPEGTFKAFETNLDRLKDMGVQTLWFMPINPISVKDRKGKLGSYYAVSSYTAINPEYGTMEDWNALVKDAHQKGFKVIIDWVPNHTGADHPWLTSHPDFFVKDSSGKPAVAFDWADVRQLDYKNPEMQDSMIASMRFWIDNSDIDGFRCDVAWNVPGEFWKKAIAQLREEGLLVGYSGGGALALLLAGRREDVWQVQTLAGNLSPAEWARMLELTPLEGSLEPLQYRERLARIPQRHLLGAEDRQVPADVAAFYARQLGEARCLELVSLPGVTHERGWQQAWPSWRQRSLACAPVERKD